MTKDGFCVYRHTAPNGKVYVGITSLSPERRWNKGLGYKKQPLFYRAIQKYGWDNFTHEVLYSGLSVLEASALEEELIRKYRSNNSQFGYNLSCGGFGGALGVKDSVETRSKKSESAKLAWENPGRKNRKKRPVVNGVVLRKGYTLKGHKKKPVIQCSLGGVLVKEWSSICEIERTLGIRSGKISECCNGKRLSVKGYKWAFAEVVT